MRSKPGIYGVVVDVVTVARRLLVLLLRLIATTTAARMVVRHVDIRPSGTDQEKKTKEKTQIVRVAGPRLFLSPGALSGGAGVAPLRKNVRGE